MYTLKICALIALAASTAAQATDAPKQGAPKQDAPNARAPAASGEMRAHIDPKTGKLTETPTAPQRPERSTIDPARIEEVHHADGIVEFRFNGQADSTQTAHLDADGNLSVGCAEHGTTHAHAAKEADDEQHR